MTSKALMTITDRAADRIKHLIGSRGSHSVGIRIGVKSGGCSGLSYSVEYADEIRQFEEVVEDKGVKLFIDPKAIMYLIGAEMDYLEEKFKSGFTFQNPNEKARCGCGKSFSA